MACIDRIPVCGTPSSSYFDSPLEKIAAFIGLITSIAGILGWKGTLQDFIDFVGISAPVLGGLLAGIAVIGVVALFSQDRCYPVQGDTYCVAGVVFETVPVDFSSGWNILFPFTATHNRIDLVLKPDFWDIAESNFAGVFCTDHPIPNRSEKLRCYYFTESVCSAAQGALIGAVIGTILGTAIVILIACAATIWCLLLAILIVAAAALAGAAAAGHIAAQDSSPIPQDNTGHIVVRGALLSITGNLVRRGEDDGANVFWWSGSTQPHGYISSSVSFPYSYCDLEEELPDDGCDPIVE